MHWTRGTFVYKKVRHRLIEHVCLIRGSDCLAILHAHMIEYHWSKNVSVEVETIVSSAALFSSRMARANSCSFFKSPDVHR